MRVMLVSESAAIREVMRTVLDLLGAEMIEEANDAQDALSKVAVFDPDLLLADWEMAGMTGVSLVRAIRLQGNSTLAILITARVEKSQVLEAIEAGVNNFVVLPFTPEFLFERISETLARAA
ncbi:MAG: response regulator [Phycisphaerae bacterium]|nr:response regulator [Phycisphaerae bacterium]